MNYMQKTLMFLKITMERLNFKTLKIRSLKSFSNQYITIYNFLM